MPAFVGSVLLSLFVAVSGWSEDSFVTLASTSSTRNSGLLDAILPVFEAKTGISVRVLATGTGQALRIARNGDADLLLVHDRASEERFVAEGWGTRRYPLMHNDFVIVGPADDPAGVRGLTDAPAALERIARTEAPFVSRGDRSGTHMAEIRLWRTSGVHPTDASGAWYRELGAGMGATLNTAAAMDAYTLADRGTWLSFRNRAGLQLLVQGDPRLHNPYGLIPVDPKRHPHVNAKAARHLVEWLISEEGQSAISGFRIEGEALFVPNALKQP